MKISIITVAYNSAATIRETIQSVLNQDYSNIEYVIVDGKSTDNTMRIVEEYKPSIQTIVSEPDYGIYDAMNKGISLCTGDVIGILNSDDLYEDSSVISTVMSAFIVDSGLQIVYGDIVYVKHNDLNKVIRKWVSKSYYTRFFEDGHVPPHPALFIRKEVYEKVGQFNLTMQLAADYEFMLRLFKRYQYKSRYINRLLVRMRLGGATNSSIKNIINGNKEILAAWKLNKLKVPYLLVPRRIGLRLVQFLR